MEATGELVAGRELDALVAERVMGETVYPDYGASNMHGVTPYSIDMAAAWQVAEKMRERFGFRGNNGFLLTTQGEGEPLWYCEFPQPWTEATGETAPEAICRAALTAVSQAE